MKTIIVLALASVVLGGCVSQGGIQPVAAGNSVQYQVKPFDNLEYGQYVGMKWLTTTVGKQCKDYSVAAANLRMLRSKAEEMEIYVSHKPSSDIELRSSASILATINKLSDEYKKDPTPEKCERTMKELDFVLEEILLAISGK